MAPIGGNLQKSFIDADNLLQIGLIQNLLNYISNH